MSTPTRSATNSLAKDSRVIYSSLSGARCRVNATPGATTVVLTDASELTNIALYTPAKPGMLVVNSAAVATNQGKTALITGISGATVTVDVDFSTILVAGDIVTILPPGSVELFLNQGHSLNAQLSNDYTMGLTETFPTHNTAMGIEVGGDVPFFQILTSEGFARLLALGIGAYKTFRTVTDGVTVNTSPLLTSATAAFTAGDVGETVSGAGIPASTTISQVVSATTAQMSANATASASGVSVTVGVSGTHKYRPIEANDGSFTEMEDGTFLVQDGNGVIREAHFGLIGTKLSLDYPEGGRAVGAVSILGSGTVREIGGTGRIFPNGTTARTVTDGVINTTTTVTSATAAFVATDVGASIVGIGIPAGTTITIVGSGTSVTISQAATATASGVTLTITRQKYIRTNFVCDTGPGITFRSAFVEFGGTFGAGLTSAVETTVKNLTVTIERGAIADRTLGDGNIIKPEEDTFTVVVTGSRIVNNDAIYENNQGGANDAEPGSGAKTTTRMLIKAISPQDPTKTLTIDIPNGVFSTRTPNRPRGRFTEQFEFRMIATLDANGCVSTSTPPMLATLVNGSSKVYSITI